MKAFLLVALLLGPAIAHTDTEDQPLYEVKDPATIENFRNLYYAVDDMGKQITTSTMTVNQMLNILGALLPPSATSIKNTITPKRAGQIIYNATGTEFCFSTGTLSSQWAKMQSTGTACSN